MDRLVKPDIKELILTFTPNQKCTSTFRLTNLMHTMSVVVSLSTTNPSSLSFPAPFSILPPLSTSSFTLHLSPTSFPPISSPPDTVLVRSSMLPIGKAQPDDLHRLFSKPTPLIFNDATIPISLIGPHIVEFLLSHPINKILEAGARKLTQSLERSKNGTLESASLLSKAISGCDQSELNCLLNSAAKNRNPYCVSALIDSGADVNNRGFEGKSVISLAVKNGDIHSVRILMESGFEIDNSIDTLLHDAAAMDQVDIMVVLCLGLQNIDVNTVDSNGQTSLHVAANRGGVKSIQFLLSMGGDPDIVDSDGRAPLHFAAAEGHAEAVELLLKTTAFAKLAVTKEGQTAFDLAAEKGHSDLYDSLGLSDELHRAARVNDVRAMKRCLAEGAKVNGRDQNGWTPLHRAAFKGGIEGVMVLLSHGAKMDVADDCGYTPLQRAAEMGHVKVAMCLIDHGAKGKAKSTIGNKKTVSFEVVPYNRHCFKTHPGISFSCESTPLCREKERA